MVSSLGAWLEGERSTETQSQSVALALYLMDHRKCLGTIQLDFITTIL